MSKKELHTRLSRFLVDQNYTNIEAYIEEQIQTRSLAVKTAPSTQKKKDASTWFTPQEDPPRTIVNRERPKSSTVKKHNDAAETTKKHV